MTNRDILGSPLMLPPTASAQFPAHAQLSCTFVQYFMHAQSAGVKFVKGVLSENITKIQHIYLHDGDTRACRYGAAGMT